METKLRGLDGETTREVTLPSFFEQEIRFDIIKRAVLSAQSSAKQPSGAHKRAGMDTTAETPPKGSGRTRVRRIQGQGYDAAGRAAWAPFTYGGRRAHPPKSEKVKGERINAKERSLAIRTAASATKDFELVSSRGHVINGIEELPIVVDDGVEEFKKTREVVDLMRDLGVWTDVERVKDGRNVRSGKGKSRGRKYKKKKGPLLVVGDDRGIFRAARNIPGVDVVTSDGLNAEHLAPGGSPARLTIWTESALDQLERRFSN